jgi:hypothetical protein
MTCGSSDHASAERLQQLTALAPDPDRAERVRVRCRARLERGTRRAARAALIHGFAYRVLAPSVLGAFCVLYILALVATTLRFRGVL